MINRLISILISYKFTAVLLIIYAIGMAVATFYEKNTSTPEAFKVFYHSPWFFVLQLLMCVNFIGLSYKLRLKKQKKWGVLLLHWGFITILIGAMVTHLFSYEGMMHIREGESSSSIYVGDPSKGTLIEVPFSVELKDFVLERYPGSSSPSSYESYVTIKYKGENIEQKIFMNNIAYVGKFRIYQTSYDKDEKGTVLTVTYDLEGMIISYLGYIIMTIGFVLSLIHPSSRFRRLSRRLSELSAESKTKSLIIAFMLMSITSSFAQTEGNYIDINKLKRGLINEQSADSIASLLIQNPNGRVEPMNSYSEKMLRKISRSSSYEGIRAEKVIVGMFSDPYTWASTPMVYVGGNRELRKIVGIDSDYASFNDMFVNGEGGYKLQQFIENAYKKEPKEQNKFDKDVIKLDEKINIMNALFQMQLLNIFPLESSVNDVWYSAGDDLSQYRGMDSMMVSKAIPMYIQANAEALQSGNWKNSIDLISHMKVYQRAKASSEHLINHSKIEAEILYNKVNIFKTSGLLYLILGFIMLVLMFMQIVKGETKRNIQLFRIVFGLVCIVFIYHTIGIGLRWYVSGRAPWTSSYEAMVYVGWCILVCGIAFVRRSHVAPAVAAMLAGVVLMISQLGFLDPEITPLVPVLKSYWLMFHVAILTASYGFFAMSALLGLLALLVMIFGGGSSFARKIEELNIINEMSITIGLVMLSIGVFIGAVWANESWGRYWGWDPKETWALITMIAYTFIIHSRTLPAFRSRYAFATMSLLSISTVLMTFFGVNYLLSGMHSYGSSEGLNFQVIISVTVVVAIICIAAWIKERKQ